MKIPGGFLGSLSKFLGRRAGTIQVFSHWQRSGSSPSLEGVRNPGEAEHGDVGGAGGNAPLPHPLNFPAFPDFHSRSWESGGVLVWQPWHMRLCRSSRSVREKLCGDKGVSPGAGLALPLPGVPRTFPWDTFPREFPREYLHAALALVVLLPTVHPLVPLQVVLLDEAHVAHVALERLLPWNPGRN